MRQEPSPPVPACRAERPGPFPFCPSKPFAGERASLIAWVLAGATVFLVVATAAVAIETYRLGQYTKALNPATQRLASVEERRDHEEARRRRLHRVSTKLQLAEKVMGASIDQFFPPVHKGVGEEFYQGAPPTDPWSFLRLLYNYLDYEGEGHDQTRQEDMDRLMLLFDGLNRGSRYPASSVEDIRATTISRVQELLGRDLFKWHNEIVKLSIETGEAPPSAVLRDTGNHAA